MHVYDNLIEIIVYILSTVQYLIDKTLKKITLSAQLGLNNWSKFHETWYAVRTSYVVVHITGKFRSSHFCGSYAP